MGHDQELDQQYTSEKEQPAETAETAEDDFIYEEEYSYDDDGDDYHYEDPMEYRYNADEEDSSAEEAPAQTAAAAENDLIDAEEHPWADEESWYDEEYVDEQSAVETEPAQPDDAAVGTAEETPEDGFSYEYDDYDSFYGSRYDDPSGYGEEYGSNDEEAGDAEEAGTPVAGNAEEAGDAEEAGQAAYGTWESDPQSADDEEVDEEEIAQPAAADALYQGYSEAYPDEESAYPAEDKDAERIEAEAPSVEESNDQWSYEEDADPAWQDAAAMSDAAVEEPAEAAVAAKPEQAYEYDEYEYDQAGDATDEADSPQQSLEEDSSEMGTEAEAPDDFSYDDADPYEYYGYGTGEVEQPPAEDAAEEVMEPSTSGLELFAWRPGELLVDSDRQILADLERLCDRPSGTRRATLNEYLDTLGMEAIDLATRFEDVTGIEVLSFADDLPAAAAFLASFRLRQQRELGIDETVDLLQRSLKNVSLDWIEGVGEIAREGLPDAASNAPGDSGDISVSDHPMVGAMVHAATHSIEGLRVVVAGVSERLAEIPWESIAARLGEGPTAARPAGNDQPVQR